MQYKLCIKADQATSLADKARTANDPRQIEKLIKLLEQVQAVMQQLKRAQVALLEFCSRCPVSAASKYVCGATGFLATTV